MTLPTKTTLKTSSVNSGYAVNMNVKNVVVNWSAFTTVVETPSQSLSPGVNAGYNNPEITISGIIDLNTTHGVDATNNLLDTTYIENFIKSSDETMTLVSPRFVTATNTAGSVSVMLKDYSDSLPNSNIISYTLKLVEVNNS